MGRGKVNTVVGADTFSQELDYDHVNMMIKIMKRLNEMKSHTAIS